jgi:PEP-CTERM motif
MFMRMSGLLGAAVAVSLLTPIAPANASLSPGFLMYTDLFLWPNWREILGKYDCTTELEFYLWNAPSPPAPVIITPPPIFDPVVIGPSKTSVVPPDPIWTPGGDAPHGPPTGPGNPIWSPGTPGLPGGDPPGGVAAVPEPSTWAMLLLGFAGLGYAGFRRKRGRKYLMTAVGLPKKPFRTAA